MKKSKCEFRPILSVGEKRITVSVPENCKAEFIGADFPQIVDGEMNIHTPLTDTSVTLSFICTDSKGNKTDSDITVLIRGEHGKFTGKKPLVIPEPAQWYSADSGKISADSVMRIAFSDKSLENCVKNFAYDFKSILGYEKQTEYDENMQNGDIFFELSEKVSYLGEEGYEIKADKKGIHITVSAKTGAVWAGKTVLQLLNQSGFPYGEMRDYPRYPIRGFMLDAGRRPMTLDMLKCFTQYMAWYKMNDFQIHLSDNYIWLEDYAEKGDASTFEAYEAFRLESSLVNENGESFTAKDFSYKKAEFREFIDWAEEQGVRIVPELDVPAHALSITKAFPEYTVKNKTSPLMDKRPLTDHLDVSRPETVDFIKRVFDDYTLGDNPVFGKNVTVHIGADEFLTDYGAYRRFLNEFIPYIKKTNKVRMWGGLTWIKDDPVTEIICEAVDGVQMNLWSSGWADGKEMYDMGYELINTIDSYLYMVPNGTKRRGAYTDLLNKKKIFKKFLPNRVKTNCKGKYVDLPAGEKRVLGAAFAIWNDNIDKRASGLTQTDTFDRFADSAPLLAEKTWGSCTDKKSSKAIDIASEAIGVPQGFKEKSGNIDLNKLKFNGAKLENGALCIKNGYAENAFSYLPVNTEMILDIEFNEIKKGQIILESDGLFGSPYDLRITENGKLGFTREGYEYEFDYIPPVNKRIQLRILSKPLRTVLKTGCFKSRSANGMFIYNGTVRRTGIKNSTLQIPVSRIGSKTNSANAKIYAITYKKI